MAARTLHGARIEVASGALASLGARLRERWPAHRVACIADATIAARLGDAARTALGADVPLLTFPAGEAAKTRETWGTLTDQLLALGYGRDTVVVGLGGGVTTDLAGFVAATYLRGVPLVLVPTSLLAMIDAAIGGKTGVDTPAGKNLVGAFHHPDLVLIDPDLLDTLPVSERRAGLAEAIKHGVIADGAYLDAIEAHAPHLLRDGSVDRAAALAIVTRSVDIKVDIVARDEREAGLRQVLNVGHTIAHALERITGYAIRHGEAVAIGMVLEARLAERIGHTPAGLADRIAAVCAAVGLPVTLPPGIDADAVVAATHGDKKSRAGQVRYSLPDGIGTIATATRGFTVAVPDPDVRRILTEL